MNIDLETFLMCALIGIVGGILQIAITVYIITRK